jgi:hypothetical protein
MNKSLVLERKAALVESLRSANGGKGGEENYG